LIESRFSPEGRETGVLLCLKVPAHFHVVKLADRAEERLKADIASVAADPVNCLLREFLGFLTLLEELNFIVIAPVTGLATRRRHMEDLVELFAV
jgi:hypothetical protein